MKPHSLLSHRDPRRIAFVEGATGRSTTWGDIEGYARSIEAPGPLGLIIDDPIEMARCFLGALAAGITVAPLSPSATDAELRQQIDALGLAAVCRDGGVTVVGGGRPVDAALLLSSSGTTGRPKVIPLTEQQLFTTAQSIAVHHLIGPADCGYSPLPLSHINGLVVGLLTTLVAGSTMVLDRKLSASTFWDTAGRYGITWLNLVPAMITILANREPPPPEVTRGIRFVRSASAPLPVEVLERFEARCGVGVLETYGMTEAASQITANPLEPSARRPGSVGRPVEIDLTIVDDAGDEVAPGVVGEVVIEGRGVRRLRTGDVGRLDEDGFLYLLARADDVINRGGEKVYPAEIEAILLADPEVTAAVVVGRRHAIIGEEPVAYVLADVSVVERTGLAERLARRCARSLSAYKRPAEITVTETLPTGPTGKVRRIEVRRRVAQETMS